MHKVSVHNLGHPLRRFVVRPPHQGPDLRLRQLPRRPSPACPPPAAQSGGQSGGQSGVRPDSATVAVMSPRDHRITLLGKPGCHLCDDARAVIERVAAELGVPWEERDITASAEDQERYWEMIPVTLVDGVQHDFWRVDENRLRAALGA
ncbi:hypothetical protein GCM10009525_79890 [Streptosporangium amethystogenes subsp. fukuiense]